jgi:hypothetical protein
MGHTWNFGASPRKGGKKLISRLPTPVFKALSYPLPKPRFNFVDTCDPTVGNGPSKNISKILLIHASLYVLAKKWGIDRLKRLTLFKIHKTLSMFSLNTVIFEIGFRPNTKFFKVNLHFANALVLLRLARIKPCISYPSLLRGGHTSKVDYCLRILLTSANIGAEHRFHRQVLDHKG